MTEPAGIEVTQHVVREMFIHDLVVSLDAEIQCDLVDDSAHEVRCPHPARWSLLFDLVGRWNACDDCKAVVASDGGVNLGDGSSVRLLEVMAL